ncbi:hypothetical protein [Miltoncostaea marina]|uniref:hypothetical protein n=1 Tax=Miltoncostaea marina TaxID=2843215 RepID=UPI001C3C6581|nr:hypothetical protein [Miltoncostaea marina]
MTEQPSAAAARLQVLAADVELEQSTVQVPSAQVPPPVDAEAIADASGGLADRMRARLNKITAQTHHDFAVPGWDGDLVVRVHYLDPETWRRLGRGTTDAELIVASTDALLLRGDAGALEAIEGAWGPTLAGVLGMPADTPATRLVAAVMADRGPWITALAFDVLSWQQGRRPKIEEALGE